jgi:hypothetical protein
MERKETSLMAIHLLNSAIMADLNGDYSIRQITVERFVEIVREQQSNIRCYIGYDANIQLIAKMTGVTFHTDRSEAKFADDDQLLIMKLRYRVQDTAMKSNRAQQAKLRVEDFDFALATFWRV